MRELLALTFFTEKNLDPKPGKGEKDFGIIFLGIGLINFLRAKSEPDGFQRFPIESVSIEMHGIY